MLGKPVTLTGMLAGSGSGRIVEVQLQGHSRSWQTVASGRATNSGAFKISWRARHVGRFLARAVPKGGHKSNSGSTPTTVVKVYRKTEATWFDQSGTISACAVKLRQRTLGVAHKTLPCGTLLDFSFRGKSITVPVIDRGPYGGGVSYDLTIEVARRLGFVETGRGTVGVLRHSDALTLFGRPLLPGFPRAVR